jgi:hypothetical protein
MIRLASAVAVAATILLGSATRSYAATIDLPAGIACEFELILDISTPEHRVFREFKDKNGNVVRTLSAGKGNTLVFTNASTGATLTLHPNGSVEHATVHPDGTTTFVVTGHEVLILFPTDVPAGPSTTLYVGRVVFDVDANGTFTLVSTSGKSTDICAALL